MKYGTKKLEVSLIERQQKLKEMLELASAGRVDEIDVDGRVPSDGERGALIKALKKSLAATSVDLEEFRVREFRLGTPQQCWAALHEMCRQLAEHPGAPIDPNLALWFVSAVNRADDGDEQSLMRELGFVRSGRGQLVDPFALTDRVLEIIQQTGGSINSACKAAAEEFGVSPKTAWYWYGKHQNAKQEAIVKALRDSRSSRIKVAK